MVKYGSAMEEEEEEAAAMALFFFFPPASLSLLPVICGDSMDERLPLGQWILLKDLFLFFFVPQLCHFSKARSFV